MHTLILIIHIVVAIMLVGIILIQRSSNDGFGLGGGASGGNLFAGRSQANFLTRTTAILATIFILTSMGLTLVNEHRPQGSIVDRFTSEAPAEQPAPEQPTGPAVPKPE